MENSTISSKALPRKVYRGGRSKLTKRHSRNGVRPERVIRSKAIPVLIGMAGIGCLLTLLVFRRSGIGDAGMAHLQDAISTARQKVRVATEASYPKARSLASDLGTGIRRWMQR